MDILILIPVVGLLLWWGAIYAMRERSRCEQFVSVRQGAMCGQCRYSLDGLAVGANCPECGADPSTVPPLASMPPRASARLICVPLMTMLACAVGSMAIGNITYIVLVLWGALGVLVVPSIVAMIMGVFRLGTMAVLLSHLCAAACAAIGLSIMYSVTLAKVQTPRGDEGWITPFMWVFGLLAVPLLTCLWEGAVVIWSQRRPKP